MASTSANSVLALFWILNFVSFPLHLIWEYFQCSPFFIHSKIEPGILEMVFASLGDLVITWFAYSTVAVVGKNWNWITLKWGRSHLVTMFLVALFTSVLIELYALSTGRWSYTEMTPLIFGRISVLPVLQLLILFPVSFLLTKKTYLKLVFWWPGKF